MARCDVCGNDYDKAFTITQRDVRTRSTASNALFRPRHRHARTAAVASLAMDWKPRCLLLLRALCRDGGVAGELRECAIERVRTRSSVSGPLGAGMSLHECGSPAIRVDGGSPSSAIACTVASCSSSTGSLARANRTRARFCPQLASPLKRRIATSCAARRRER